MEIAQLSFAIVGVVEFVKRLFDKDFRTAAIIIAAGIAGALLAPQISVTWFQGLLIGLGASGVVTTASYLGGR